MCKGITGSVTHTRNSGQDSHDPRTRASPATGWAPCSVWCVGVACGVVREVYAWGGGVGREGVALVAYGVCVCARAPCGVYNVCVCAVWGVCVCRVVRHARV
jgi:hypothetical protein